MLVAGAALLVGEGVDAAGAGALLPQAPAIIAIPTNVHRIIALLITWYSPFLLNQNLSPSACKRADSVCPA